MLVHQTTEDFNMNNTNEHLKSKHRGDFAPGQSTFWIEYAMRLKNMADQLVAIPGVAIFIIAGWTQICVFQLCLLK